MAAGTHKCIDREVEQEIFEDMLQIGDRARLLTIRDGGGRGKSSLLRQLRYICGWRNNPPVPASLVLLDQLPEPTPFALVGEIVTDLTSTVHFPSYTKLNVARAIENLAPFAGQSAGQSGTFHGEGILVSGSGNVFGGIVNNYANAQIGTLNVSRAWTAAMDVIARQKCVDAFFADLRPACAELPVVIMLDSWERGNPEVNEWIVDHLLRWQVFDVANRPAKLLVVLAGRELPDFCDMLGEAVSGQVVRSIESLGDWEPEHVREFLTLHGYADIEDDEVEFLCSRLKAKKWPLRQVLDVYDAYRRTLKD